MWCRQTTTLRPSGSSQLVWVSKTSLCRTWGQSALQELKAMAPVLPAAWSAFILSAAQTAIVLQAGASSPLWTPAAFPLWTPAAYTLWTAATYTLSSTAAPCLDWVPGQCIISGMFAEFLLFKTVHSCNCQQGPQFYNQGGLANAQRPMVVISVLKIQILQWLYPGHFCPVQWHSECLHGIANATGMTRFS